MGGKEKPAKENATTNVTCFTIPDDASTNRLMCGINFKRTTAVKSAGLD